MKSAERFITPELKSFEDKIHGARDRALSRERELYDALLDALTAALPRLQRTAAALADIDVLTCFAGRAMELGLVRPELVDEPSLRIDAGRLRLSFTDCDAAIYVKDHTRSSTLKTEVRSPVG